MFSTIYIHVLFRLSAFWILHNYAEPDLLMTFHDAYLLKKNVIPT